MNQAKPLTIGIASCVQPSFWGSSKDLFRTRYLPALERLSNAHGFALATWRDDIVTDAHAAEAVRFFNDARADFVLLQCTTFPGGSVILPFTGLSARLGLWAVPECTRGGPIPLNSFCGVNMLASILGQYADASRPVKWFYGHEDDPLFLRRFEVTLAALRGLKQLRGAKIGLIGGIAPGFVDFAFDERKTKARLGVTVDRLPEFGDVKARADAYSASDIAPVAESFASGACCVTAGAKGGMEATARVYKAIEDMIEENGYDAVAIGCWPKYRATYGIVACSIIGRLLETGRIAACEGDVDSAASLLMLAGISQKTPMLMDLSDVDFTDDTALLWHCGSAPASFAGAAGMALDKHYKPGSRAPGADAAPVGCVNDMLFAPGDITVARFTWEYEKALVLSGKIVEKDDKGFDGSRGWMGDIRIAGAPANAETLVNTILTARFQHHYPIASGLWGDEVAECLTWLGVSPIEAIPYKAHLQPFGG